MNKNANDELINKAARDVLILARNTLIVKFRFLDIALGRLEPVPSDEETLATDGSRFTYGPRHVLRCFRSERDKPAHDYLHVILHCIFSHMFVGSTIDRKLWDLSCDIAVENTIYDLGLRMTGGDSRQDAQRAETERLRAEAGMLTAEKIYHYYKEACIPDFEIERLRGIFAADDHSGWYKGKKNPESDSRNDDRGLFNQSDGGVRDDVDPLTIPDYEMEDRNRESVYSMRMPLEEAEEEWKKIAEKIQEDLETFSREQGDAAGGLMQNLSEVNRERYDYASFLKRFSVLGENMAINDEEFDYIYYTYGLKLYGNMPLIEPLEYKEVMRIREFVIAIDTSASTSGLLVQSFLQKTYNILKSTESFFSSINIHIIQCDAAIQEHVKITSEEEFDDYISTMSIHGLGGTDFRPVFNYIDSLIDEGEFRNLRGLIYFTDGNGTFPVRKPAYETAFIFLDNEYNNPEVPPWAIRLVLQKEEISP